MSDEETPTCRCLRLIISIKAEDTTPATVALLTDTHVRVDTDTDVDMATDTDTDTQIHLVVFWHFKCCFRIHRPPTCEPPNIYEYSHSDSHSHCHS